MSVKLRLIVNPNPPTGASDRDSERGGPDIVAETWRGFCHLRGQLDGIEASWTADTHPIEKSWHAAWSTQLNNAMDFFLAEHPQFKPRKGGGER